MDFTPLIVMGSICLGAISLYFISLVGKIMFYTSEFDDFKQFLQLKDKFESDKKNRE